MLYPPRHGFEVNMSVHTVRPGETPASFAARFSMSADELARLNRLGDPHRLTAGLALAVPGRGGARGKAVILNCLASSADGIGAGELLEESSFVCCGSCRVTAEGGAEAPRGAALVRAALCAGAAPLLCLVNVGPEGAFSPRLAHALLSDGDAQERLLRRVCALAAERGFLGAELCFQYLLPFDGEAMARFVSLAARRLHESGLYLLTALCPEGGARAEDCFSAAAAEADYVSVLCRGGGDPYSEPQPLSPLRAQREALETAARLAPREKLLLASSGCGCSWPLGGGEGELVPPSAAAALAVSTRSRIRYEPADAAAHFRYVGAAGEERELWYEDARAESARLSLIRSVGAAGLSVRRADPADAASLLARRELCRAEKFI